MAETISERAAFCLWQLMLGGIDETQPLRLSALTGVDAYLLDRDTLARVFVASQRQYGGYSWANPADRVRILGVGFSVKLPGNPALSLVCAHCGHICRYVPCQACNAQGRPPKWATRERRLYVPGFGQHRTPSELAVTRSLTAYHGSTVN